MSEIFNNYFKYIKFPLKYLVSTKITDGPHETPVFVEENGVPFISVDGIDNGQLIISDSRMISFKNAERYGRKCQPIRGDILIGKAASTGKIAQVRTDEYFSIWSPLAMVRPNDLIKSTYLEYFLKSHLGQIQLDLFANENTQKNIGMGDLERTQILVPSLGEQIKIADYLDKKVFSIDDIIKNEESAIEELKKYKFSIISNGVLHGFRDEEQKSSHYSWIESYSNSWDLGKIGSLCYLKGRIGWQGLTASEYQETGPYLITGTDFVDGKINWETCEHITEKRYEEATPIKVKNGDLLITKDGTVGKVAIVSDLIGKASLNSGVLLVRGLTKKYINKFLYYVLNSSVFWSWFEKKQKGNSTIVHLYQEQFSGFIFPLPSISEQELIVAYLDDKCSKIDELIFIKEEKIETLKAYKKSLIYECVTGKKEVPYAR